MLRYWESPETTSVNRLTPQPLSNDNVESLNGTWRFQLVDAPYAEPSGSWCAVAVPSLWTMGDVGDPPQYTNVQMPFDEQPPFVPASNPTGVYERSFTVPEPWSDRRIVLRIGGFEGVLRIELNGDVVGMAKDGRIAAEFDITAELLQGANTLRLIISKWSDATFIEDQDQWWHAGITRDVGLLSTPRTHVDRLQLTPSMAADRGILRLRATLAFAGGLAEAGHRLRIRIPELEFETAIAPSNGVTEPPTSKVHQALARAWFTSEFVGCPAPEELAGLLRQWEPAAAGNCDVTLDLPGVTPWSAERPKLYDLHIDHLDTQGEAVEQFNYRLGFRSVVVDGRELLVNGQPVMLQGVNRHDFHPRTGRVLSVADIREDLLELKRWNVNAIRTSHYPNDPALLCAADELGFYVVAEANIESHAHMHTIADDPRYLSAFVDRVSRLVQRDLHHASVVLWSLGNESGYGANHEAAASWVRRYDATRPLHYEGAIRGDWSTGHSVTDVVCPMYPSIAAIVRFAESGRQTRPLIMCEYSHAMGNSNGSLAEYWDAIERHPGLQGGFIWEMWDHGLVQTMDDGSERYAYGGDFGEARHDGNFCCDGVFFPDRTAKPAMHEFKQLGAPLVITALEPAEGRFLIRNRQFFLGSEDYCLKWELSEDGVVVAEGQTEMPEVAPRSTTAFILDLAPERQQGAGERFLTMSVLRRDASPWAAPMSEVGWAQFPLPSVPTLPQVARARTKANILRDGDILLDAMQVRPRLSLWRAPTDNDRIGGAAERWHHWGVRDLERRIDEVEHLGNDGMSFASHWQTASGTSIEHQQIVVGCEGGIRVREHVFIPADLDDLARVGIAFTLPFAQEVEWFGAGPHETYPDRSLARIGRWSRPGDRTQVDYIRPQSNGARLAVRWLNLRIGRELWCITNDVPRQMSFIPYSEAELADAGHREELGTAERTVIHIDAAHRGLGTASCGPDILERYRVPTGVHSWTWSLQRLH